MKIEIKILEHAKEFYNRRLLLGRATAGSAAIDLMCIEDVTFSPSECILVKTGIAIHIDDENIAALILPRSGLGHKGLILGNSVGLIDSDYQGEIKVSVLNRNPTLKLHSDISLKTGDRFAQILFMPILKPTFEMVEDFSKSTARGVGGFGSTKN